MYEKTKPVPPWNPGTAEHVRPTMTRRRTITRCRNLSDVQDSVVNTTDGGFIDLQWKKTHGKSKKALRF